jgi:hypothetical protein
MKTIRNTTNAPVAVPLPGGRKLHLGPGQSGEISAHASEHPPLTALVASGALTVEESSRRGTAASPSGARVPGTQSAGHHPANKAGRRGDR